MTGLVDVVPAPSHVLHDCLDLIDTQSIRMFCSAISDKHDIPFGKGRLCFGTGKHPVIQFLSIDAVLAACNE